MFYMITLGVSVIFTLSKITNLNSVLTYFNHLTAVTFVVFTAVTMKNGVFWDVTPCGSCKN
jgi:hypothetical protein